MTGQFTRLGSVAAIAASCVGAVASAQVSTSQAPLLATTASACQALENFSVPSSAIGLPSNGAVVRKARFVTQDGAGGSSFCEVDGAIRPVDPQAPDIQFNLALPARWNGKALHLMGGGYDGVVVKGSSPVVGADRLPTPLQRGYAAFGSDSGHSITVPDWALNDEALENFAGNQLRKTRDAAVAVMVRYFGRAPERTYSAGGSGGGREALYVADRWPALYDGVISFFPVWSAVGAFTGWISSAQAVSSPGHWSNPAKQQLISRAVIAKCDGLDGLRDAIVGNIAACRFDPASLRCKGADSNECLTDAQIAAVRRGYGTAGRLPYPLSHQVTSYVAMNTLNAGAVPRMGTMPPKAPVTKNMAFGAWIADPFVRYFVTRNPGTNVFNFRMNADAETRARMRYLSSRMDVDPTMRGFVAKGGKVLIVHGNVDQLNSADWSDEFFRRFVSAHGRPSAGNHLRYYRVPGYDHGTGFSGGFQVEADTLTALEQWVENGVAPRDLVAKDTGEANSGRTRPLCEYPRFPRYRGSGNPNSAANWSCAIR
jgi:hypothetical protein